MYTFTYGGADGQEYQLTEASDMVVVRTTGGELENLPLSDTSRSLIPHLVPIATFPEADVIVYRIVSHGGESVLKMRNALRRELSKEAQVRFAGRVLKHAQTGTLFVYTENFFVQFNNDLSEEACRRILEEHDLQVKEKLVFATNAFFAKAKEGTGLDIFAIANKLLAQVGVVHCHPELIREKKHKAIVHPMQWHLRATVINGTPIDQHVGIDEAWEVHRGEGMTIAVIDDGVDDSHEEFNEAGKIIFPRNTVRDRDDARPLFDRDNHGTACAGVACASGNHKASGVAPQARLMPIVAGGLGSLAEAKAFAWAADRGADVISCSWGPVDGDWSNPGDPLHTRPFRLPDSTRLAIDYATTQGRRGKGCVITWAAGNGNEDIRFDGYASYPKVIAVAACNDQGRRSVYSDYGDAVWCCFPSSDFYAPQFNHPRPLTPGIWTTDRSARAGYNPGGINAEDTFGDFNGDYTARFGGTSSSCPGVAGVAALILGVNPDLTWEEVKTIIRQSCEQIDPVMGGYDDRGHSVFYGFGRLHAGVAVRRTKATVETLESFDVEGMAFFNYASAAPVREGAFTRDEYLFNRLVGMRLQLAPFHPGLSIRYRTFIHKLGPSPWVENGAYTGTYDRRRKLIGLQIELCGPLAADYTVEYEAERRGRRETVSGKDGSVCGTDNRRGPALEEIKIAVHRR